MQKTLKIFWRMKMSKLINKKQEIKKRIELINKGEVPKGYKKSSTKVFPKDWNEEKLENLCIKRTKTVRNRVLETLSISAGIGFVNQAQKFGRESSYPGHHRAPCQHLFRYGHSDHRYGASKAA